MSDIVWEPTEDFKKATRVWGFMESHGIKTYEELIKRSNEDIEWFWAAALEDLNIEFFQPYTKVLDSSDGIPWTKWFIGGTINIAYNCVDRHVEKGRGDRRALVWEGENGDVREMTFKELHEQVNRCANGLKALGVNKGDTVGIYMPMSPEIVVQLLATVKIGAISIPIFSGYAPPAVAERLEGAEAKVLFTANGSFRRGKPLDIKTQADKAVDLAGCVQKVVVFKRNDVQVPWNDERDIWWSDFMDGQSAECESMEMDSMDPAIIIYTSGTTGRPKGTVHSHAGTLAQVAKEVGWFFDIQDHDLFFWLTDIGWMMGPWMIIGAFNHGGTIFMYEGAPNYPGPDRLWDMIERHKITILGISPTAIRMLMRSGLDPVKKHDLTSLRIIGSTGEPWDTDSWMWFFENIGGKRCPVINISGGTDIVGCFLAPLPICKLKPCTLRGPGPGMDIDVWDEDGKPIRNEVGYLVCKKPAPSMTRGLWKAPDKYIEAYWSTWPDIWNHGDWAIIDEDGFWFLRGRADDTIKVAGRRIGPGELEGALIEHEAVSEAAAIGVPHDIKGEGIVCFVVLHPNVEPNDELVNALKDQVAGILGKVDKPEDIIFVKALPKTRSAKIVRRIIKAKFLGKAKLGDLASLENPEAVDEIPVKG
jgi:acetyl-CoA synthetase